MATQHSSIARGMLLLALVVFVPILSINPIQRVRAASPFTLDPVPAATSEGNTVSLVLSAISAVPNIQYRFRFFVTDPAGRTTQSIMENYTTVPNQYSFTMVVVYPSPALPGSNTLAGQYGAKVDELWPTAAPGVAGTSFTLSITDSSSYQRTHTVMIQASGYNVSESVTVRIRTQTTSTLVFSALLLATGAGIVATSWKIPRNATIDVYTVTITGTSTIKNPADSQRVSIVPAIMIISSITSFKSTYQRTDTMGFFFQPTYPDGSVPSTGVGLLTLARPSGGSVTLTATYDITSQTFVAFYQTSLDNQTGTWTTSLSGHAYSDTYGNSGPGIIVSSTSQLTTIPLVVSVTTNSTIAVGQQLKFNATVSYPDGGIFRSGTVKAYLLFSGTPVVNDTVPVVFDTTLGQWLGTYTVRSSDTGGLWSLVVKASDSPTPPNTGSASRAITIQNTSGGSASLPLYYFGIIAALLASLLVAVFLAFRRRKVTHARLKIDLDAVRSEAGRIESTNFFQSVKEQVRKDKDDK